MRSIRRWALVVTILGGVSLALPERAEASGPCYVCSYYPTCPSQSTIENDCDFFCGGYSWATCGQGDFCGEHDPGDLAPVSIGCYGEPE